MAEDRDPPRPSDAIDDEDTDDPIIASYDVFLTPKLPEDKELLIINYFNKFSPDPSVLKQPPILDFRLKPNNGYLEMDIPIDTEQYYNRGKGVKLGTALHKSNDGKSGGGLGLPGGFGVGGINPAARAAAGRRGNNDAEPVAKLLKHQTLGGVKPSNWETQDMVAVFHGKNIHFTPVTSTICVRPQLHQMDAVVEQEKLTRPPPPGATATAADKAPSRAIQMTVKAAMEDDGPSTETIVDRMRAMKAEPWKHFTYHDDEMQDSWDAYKKWLLVKPSDDDDDEGKGKGKEGATGSVGASAAPDLAERVPQLRIAVGSGDGIAGKGSGDAMLVD